MLSLDYVANSNSPVFQYLSQIETGNPRFPRKEDVLWYLICVSTMIIVSLVLRSARPTLAFSSLLFLPCDFIMFSISLDLQPSTYLPA